MGLATARALLEAGTDALLDLCDRRINPAVPDASGQLFQAAVNAGHAGDDFAILSKFMRKQMPEHSAKVSIA
jgi:hypothetical protein